MYWPCMEIKLHHCLPSKNGDNPNCTDSVVNRISFSTYSHRETLQLFIWRLPLHYLCSYFRTYASPYKHMGFQQSVTGPAYSNFKCTYCINFLIAPIQLYTRRVEISNYHFSNSGGLPVGSFNSGSKFKNFTLCSPQSTWQLLLTQCFWVCII